MSTTTYRRDTRYIDALEDARTLAVRMGIGEVTVTETLADLDSDATVFRSTATYTSGPWDRALTAAGGR